MSETDVKWTEGDISILCGQPDQPHGKEANTSRRSVKADIYGPFAVHQSWDFKEPWVVTHRPTGRFIWAFSSKAKAVTFCVKALPLLDWETLPVTERAPDSVTELLRSVR